MAHERLLTRAGTHRGRHLRSIPIARLSAFACVIVGRWRGVARGGAGWRCSHSGILFTATGCWQVVRDGTLTRPGGKRDRMTTGSFTAAHVLQLTTALAERYRLEREVGAGGMATVWLAEDVRHRRRVAIKVLYPELSAVIGAERFLQEIELTAGLQHPHILPLFDSGQAGGLLYYVMPFVEGETLRARLERERQLPVPDTLRIAREVADALDYAHKRGVIHRDVKPENILLQDGRVMVADFGIALAVQQAGGQRMTQTGLSLGTPQYMAPEQATGERQIDARADVYALGAMTYEMLAGEPPFTAPTMQGIVAKLLTETPRPLATLRRTVPPHVAAAVQQALEKLPADRHATAGAFAAALTDTGTASSIMFATAAAPRTTRRAIGALGLLSVASIAAALWGWMRPTALPTILRYAVDLDPNEALVDAGRFGRMMLSPDGSMLVYIGGPKRALMLRRRDALHAKAIPGTDFAGSFCFSPDGRRIAFFNSGALKIVALDGTPPITVTSGTFGRLGLSWGDDDKIYGDQENLSPLVRIAAREGATPEQFTTLDSATREVEQYFPVTLPGGKSLLYLATRSIPVLEGPVMWVDLTTGARRLLVQNATRAAYSATGHLVYATVDGTLMAAPFDAAAGKLTGEAAVVAEGLAFEPNRLDFSVSRSGTLAYTTGVAGAGNERELVWVDRSGGEQALDSTWIAPFTDPAISPDGQLIAVSTAGSYRQTAGDIWIRRVSDRTNVKLSVERGVHSFPRWSPDSKRLTYVSAADSTRSIVLKPADGSAPPTVLIRMRGLIAGGLSPDDTRLFFAAADPQPHAYVRGIRDSVNTRALPTETGVELNLVPKADGKLIAYVVTAYTGGGLPSVYVSPYPNTTAAKWLVSNGPAMWPVWSPRGDELFYRDVSTQRLMAVPIRMTPTFSAGAPRPLFPVSQYAPTYDVTADGSRFLMVRGVGAAPREQLIFVENWVRDLDKRK